MQSNLGHTTSAFTKDVYCHVSESMVRESAAKTQKFYESVKPAWNNRDLKAGKGKTMGYALENE